jgi:molybdopterin-guanine dinucleotide biosynthesis protein A
MITTGFAPGVGGVCGVLLAGGRARRMGGEDKCLRRLGDRTLLRHVIDRASAQASPLLLNANGDARRFAEFDLPVAADAIDGFVGPLAGILTGLEWMRTTAPECAWLASFATDAPFFPADMVRRMMAAVTEQDAELACAASNGRAHPVFGLWSAALADDLRRALEVEGVRKIDAWTSRYRLATVMYSADPHDPFLNINRPEDLAAAERLVNTSKTATAGAPTDPS